MDNVHQQQPLNGEQHHGKGPRKASKQVGPAEHERFKKETQEYFEAKREKLQTVKTTTTPSGQVLDWIPVESQGSIAAPPPNSQLEVGTHSAVAELEQDSAEKGPPGTVPVPRKNLNRMSFNKPLKTLLSKAQGKNGGILSMKGDPSDTQPPAVTGTHRYGYSRQDVVCFGGEGTISVWDPWVETTDDFSLLQIGLLNDADQPVAQTVEAGWQVYEELYGDAAPHLFVYYTTNGYSGEGDNIGGYNRDVHGWVQVDDTIFPETRFSPTSIVGGEHYTISIKYQLYNGGWWLQCQGRWIGYYPTSLWQGSGSTFEGLGDHATHVAFFGEVFDSDEVAGKTKTDMGSGLFPDDPRQDAAWMSNLKYQSDRGGGMQDYNAPVLYEPDPEMYLIEQHFGDVATQWGSWMYVGGPGAG